MRMCHVNCKPIIYQMSSFAKYLDKTFVFASVIIFCFRFPPSATSYVLQQFSQYGNILKHVVSPFQFHLSLAGFIRFTLCRIILSSYDQLMYFVCNMLNRVKRPVFSLQTSADGNWMHLHYQSKIQAKKALSKHGKVFGGNIMVGVTPCIDKVCASSKLALVAWTVDLFLFGSRQKSFSV